MKDLTLWTYVSLWPVFDNLQHLLLMLKDARAQLQRGNPSSLCDCPYESNSWKVNLHRISNLCYYLVQSYEGPMPPTSILKIFPELCWFFVVVVLSLVLYTPTFFFLSNWIWKSGTQQFNVNGKIWKHGFTNCAVNSNKFFIIITTAYVSSEKKQGNELQPNSEWELDITPSPTDVIC